jgi:hypothetical protein
MSATIIPFKPKQADDDPPRRRSVIGRELWSALLGMTPRQSEMAFQLSFRNTDKGVATREALCRYIEAVRDFEPVLAEYREELLKNMDAHCPRAAKRLREGKPPRGRRRSALCTEAEAVGAGPARQTAPMKS